MAAPGLKGEVNRWQEVSSPFPGGYIVWEGKLVVWGNRIEFKSYRSLPLIPVWPQGTHLTSLSLSMPICEIEVIIVPTVQIGWLGGLTDRMHRAKQSKSSRNNELCTGRQGTSPV